MKTLNLSNVSTFCQLIEMMDSNECRKITNVLLSLIMEETGENIVTPMGMGCAYSLSYYYEFAL